MRLPRGFIHPTLLAMALAVPSTVLADKGGHGRGHHKKEDDRRVVVLEGRSVVRPPVLIDRSDIRFRGMDRNGDGVITRAEWRGNSNSFRVHDGNRDGILSGAEVRRVRLGGQGPVSDRFLGLDRNRDGVLTLVEWPGSTDIFSRLDRNRDGLVTRTEFLFR